MPRHDAKRLPDGHPARRLMEGVERVGSSTVFGTKLSRKLSESQDACDLCKSRGRVSIEQTFGIMVRVDPSDSKRRVDLVVGI